MGRPFDFPDSYIEFLSFLKIGFDAPYRVIEGAVEALGEYISFIKDTCFTQIRRRMLHLMKGKKPADIVGAIGDDDNPKEPITLAIDSTGLTTTNRGSYIEDKWETEKRKFLKLHILADKKTGKIAGFRVTSEHTGDSKKFVPLVKEKQGEEDLRRWIVRCEEEFQSLGRTGYRTCNQDAKERSNIIERISSSKGRNSSYKKARFQGMEETERSWKEMDG